MSLLGLYRCWTKTLSLMPFTAASGLVQCVKTDTGAALSVVKTVLPWSLHSENKADAIKEKLEVGENSSLLDQNYNPFP